MLGERTANVQAAQTAGKDEMNTQRSAVLFRIESAAYTLRAAERKPINHAADHRPIETKGKKGCGEGRGRGLLG